MSQLDTLPGHLWEHIFSMEPEHHEPATFTEPEEEDSEYWERAAGLLP